MTNACMIMAPTRLATVTRIVAWAALWLALQLGALGALPLLGPSDGQKILGNVVRLSWGETEGVEHYEVWIDGNHVETVSGGVRSYSSFPLSFGEHEWRVVAIGKDGVRSVSATRRFLLEDEPLRELPEGSQLLRYDWKMQAAELARMNGGELTGGAVDDSGWHGTSLPATCLTVLVRNGVYPNPYVKLNNLFIPDLNDTFNETYGLLQYSHIPGKNPWKLPYWFRTEFVASASVEEARRVWLNLGEINYRAEVWLNGVRLGTAQELVGMERTFRLDATEALQRGGLVNRLAIAIFPPDNPGEPAPPPVEPLADPGRNMGADMWISRDYTKWDSVGWDWQPAARDRDMGLVEDVFLEPSGDCELGELYVAPVFEDGNLKRADLAVWFTLRNHAEAAREGLVTIEIANPEGRSIARFERAYELAAGQSDTVRLDGSQVAELKIKNPQLWWPHGYGEQPLYELRARLETKDGQSDAEKAVFGFRKVDTHVQASSNSRVFVVNGETIYSQGGNWVIDWLLNWPASRYEREIASAKRANLNTLRIWGPTGVAPKRFYEAADRAGVLIWQDFLNDFWGTEKNTPGSVPEESLFREASIEIVKKLRNHASLVIWCGGNEGVNPRESLLRSEVLGAHDPLGGRYYLPASDGDGLKGGGPYHNLRPRAYFGHGKISGFNSEIGPSGVPEWESLPRFLDLEAGGWAEGRFPINGEWTYHDATNRGDDRKYTHYDDVLRHSYGAVEGPGSEALRAYVWKAQLVNYEAYRSSVEALNKDLGVGNTGFSFWKYNSSWPSVLWQLIDWYEQPHAGFYGARKALEQLHPQYNYDDGSVTVVNRSLADRKLSVLMEGFDVKGRPTVTKREKVKVGGGSARKLMQLPGVESDVVSFLRLTLLDERGGQVSTNTYWLHKDDRFESLWDQPEAEVVGTARLDQGKIVLDLSCSGSAPVVFARVRAVDATTGLEALPSWWSDNYVTLMPGETRRLVGERVDGYRSGVHRIEVSSPFGAWQTIEVLDER